MTPFFEGLLWREAPPEWSAEETGATLTANALIKARSARAYAKPEETVLAEDTGLFVWALGGAPGVFSARYAGEGVSFDQNVAKLLRELAPYSGEARRASFLTAAAAIRPDGAQFFSCGRLDGVIAQERRGAQGFGYDPVFIVPSAGRALAEFSLEEKNTISHRGRAIGAIRPYLAVSAASSVS
ncbi:MAG: non-canonical purine NTP pyrophosphatase [Elusimicrobia bacterium]|nr:non-canonical purine NTP pyrophosphatase [Elusimicrobiota bacterium]